ncbi:MAG: gamma-glutamylcyclotransferase [Methylophaga sp.]|nr:gamma-glutamylcyclotransferase [Methylophaga sp.]
MQADYLFVYGSLRSTASHHHLLANHCQYIGNASARGLLFQVADYPGLVMTDDSASSVIGELYQLHDLSVWAALDYYEGCSDRFPEPYEFVRQIHKVTLEQGDEVNAWIYVYNFPFQDLPVISSGDFLSSSE